MAALYETFENVWMPELLREARTIRSPIQKMRCASCARKPFDERRKTCLVTLRDRNLRAAFPALASETDGPKARVLLKEAQERLDAFFLGSGFALTGMTALYLSGRVNSLQLTLSWR
jgi:hypothetical protein